MRAGDGGRTPSDSCGGREVCRSVPSPTLAPWTQGLAAYNSRHVPRSPRAASIVLPFLFSREFARGAAPRDRLLQLIGCRCGRADDVGAVLFALLARSLARITTPRRAFTVAGALWRCAVPAAQLTHRSIPQLPRRLRPPECAVVSVTARWLGMWHAVYRRACGPVAPHKARRTYARAVPLCALWPLSSPRLPFGSIGCRQSQSTDKIGTGSVGRGAPPVGTVL